MNEALSYVSSFIYAAVLAGTPLLFGTLGEIITEKAGNLNLGVEGMMYMGAVFGFMGAYYLDSAIATLLFAFLGGLGGALVYAFLTVTLKANQNVAGLTLTIFGTGLANLLGTNMINGSGSGAAMVSDAMKAFFRPMDMGALTAIPYLGKLLFNHSLFTYLGIVLAIAAGWYLNPHCAGAEPAGCGRKSGRRRRRGRKRQRIQVCPHPAGRRYLRPGWRLYRAGDLRRKLDVQLRGWIGMDCGSVGDLCRLEPV